MKLFADIALPVPLDQVFTYVLPDAIAPAVRIGCRMLVPFGSRTLSGVVTRVHDEVPEGEVRAALRLLDTDPVIEDHMIALGRWIANYYCAPVGEVLRGMVPLSGEVRKSKIFSLTDAGRDAARQLFLGVEEEDPTLQILRLLESRSSSESFLRKKVNGASVALRSLSKKGYVEVEDVHADRDPLRAASARLRLQAPALRPEGKFRKSERELLAFLELHPGYHNLAELEGTLKGASEAARALARRQVLTLEVAFESASAYPFKAPPVLNGQQQEAFDSIRQAVELGHFAPFLLQGVTGSGKTEVYLRAIEATLATDRNCLLLVPEIALTPAVAGQFYHRFGDGVAILHSAFQDAERAEQWRRIRSGRGRVVVGTRSGIFAPVQNLGLIIVDEEHDGSYKQQETPRYSGRDVAVMRARMAGACVVLGSATPSLETRYNVQRGKYRILHLTERVERRPMPSVELVDMRVEFLETRKQETFSRRLVEVVQEKLRSGEQVMLLHNRRGFSTFAACRSCGERVQCINCSVALTYHRRDKRMLCHYCGYAAAVPAVCPACKSDKIYFLGIGSEKVEEELHRSFPGARIARLDRDTAGGKRTVETILTAFRERAYDILVGTQMIAKGHDIPNVTLAGVISGDIGLGMPDFRAAERTFQLLTQVAGRAGRGHLAGQVVIQTINPEHYAIRMAAAQDFGAFYDKEMEFRRAMRYPPFAALANVILRSRKQEDALRLSSEISHLLTPPPANMRVLGPAEAAVPRMKDEYRYQLLLKAVDRKVLNDTLQRLRSYALEHKWSPTAMSIDVDPISLL